LAGLQYQELTPLGLTAQASAWSFIADFPHAQSLRYPLQGHGSFRAQPARTVNTKN
jgi:hypothetical protein